MKSRQVLCGRLVAASYIFLIEVCSWSVVESGVKWPPYSDSAVILSQTLMLHPEIHSPQTKLTVQNGDTVNLPCKVHNLGESQVLWRHGTNILAGSNVTTYADERIQLLPDFTLQITGVTHHDEGSYECLITSWPNLKLTHSLVVQDAPQISLLTPSSIQIKEGESIEIGCIPRGNPLPKVSWSMRDGQLQLPPNAVHQPKLLLENVGRKHAGLYICTADNGIGRPAIGAIYVRVLYSPEIETPKRRVHGGVGYKGQLVAIVHADPRPEVFWRIGDKLVPMDHRVFTECVGLNEYHLIFKTVRQSDFNTYTIEANNSLGYEIRHIEFSGVPNSPILNRWETELWKNKAGQEEVQVSLYWAVECYSPLIDYKLFFRVAPLPQTTSWNEDKTPPWSELTVPADQDFSRSSFLHTRSVTLKGLQNGTIYEAAVKARNKYGWSPLSSVCYFATFPNSSSSKSEKVREILSKMNSSALESDYVKKNTSFYEKAVKEAIDSSSARSAVFLNFSQEWLKLLMLSFTLILIC